ncbi:MAG TPA: hypothetical protein VFK10_01440, partial [Burkholderiaceae bacterium]|nr:hypothetical protein [Burkholderiaceae bacterium]
LPDSQGDIVILQNPFNASAVEGNTATTHSDGSDQGGGESSGQTGAALDPADAPQAALVLAQAAPEDEAGHDGDALAAVLGLASMCAVQVPAPRTLQVRRKKP